MRRASFGGMSRYMYSFYIRIIVQEFTMPNFVYHIPFFGWMQISSCEVEFGGGEQQE